MRHDHAELPARAGQRRDLHKERRRSARRRRARACAQRNNDGAGAKVRRDALRERVQQCGADGASTPHCGVWARAARAA